MIKIDLHTHSVASGHGTNATITDMAKAAKNKDINLLGICDHGPQTLGGPSISYFRSISLAPKTRCGVSILYGIEANILDVHGTLDIPSDIAASLDYVIASMHTCNIKPSDARTNTDAYIHAMENPFVSFIGHCDDIKYPVFMKDLVQAAIRNHVILELNNASLKSDSYRGDTKSNDIALLQYCKELKHPIILSSDSHGPEDIGNFKEALTLIHEVQFPEEYILNHDINKIRQFLSK